MISEIIQSARAEWTETLENYKPSAGWVLTVYFRGPGAGLNLEATSENDSFRLTLSSAQSAALAVGNYAWQSFAEKAGEKVFIAEGKIQVKKGFAATAANEAIDSRSEVKKILDAIDACLTKKATADQLSYTIGNRQLARYSMTDLLLARDKYQKMYNREKLAERARRGGGILKTHLVRMKGE